MLITLRVQRVKILESQPPLPKKEHQKTKKQNKKKRPCIAAEPKSTPIGTEFVFLMNYKLVDLHVPVSCSICLSSF